MNSITVLLVDDHTLVRKGFRSLLELAEGITVIGEAQNGREAIVLAKLHRPDVVIMDFLMPRLNGLEATRQILTVLPATKVVVISGRNDEAHVNSVIAVGAAGYLFKQNSAEMLTRAIREVHAGKRFFSPAIVNSFENKRSFSKSDELRMNGFVLTAREVEIVQLVAESYGNKQMAQELGISTKTVEKHRQKAMDKLNIHDTAGLTRYAIAQGIVENNFGLAAARRLPAPSPRQARAEGVWMFSRKSAVFAGS